MLCFNVLRLADWFFRRRMYFDQDQSRDLSQSRVSEHDDRDARHWTRKLYEFESKDPDRYKMTKSSSKYLLNFCTFGQNV